MLIPRPAEYLINRHVLVIGAQQHPVARPARYPPASSCAGPFWVHRRVALATNRSRPSKLLMHDRGRFAFRCGDISSRDTRPARGGGRHLPRTCRSLGAHLDAREHQPSCGDWTSAKTRAPCRSDVLGRETPANNAFAPRGMVGSPHAPRARACRAMRPAISAVSAERVIHRSVLAGDFSGAQFQIHMSPFRARTNRQSSSIGRMR